MLIMIKTVFAQAKLLNLKQNNKQVILFSP